MVSIDAVSKETVQADVITATVSISQSPGTVNEILYTEISTSIRQQIVRLI